MTSTPEPIATVDPQRARAILEEGALLLDVREDDEWECGHVAGALHIPMGEVLERIEEVPADRRLVCVCRVGGRSGAVAAALADAGYDVCNLDGGMLAWESAGFPIIASDGGPGRVI